MRPELAALVVHDLKNALGALEDRLLKLQDNPVAAAARRAHRECRDLRERFVMFLTLYSLDGELAALREDESPHEFLSALAARLRADDDAPALHLQLDASTPACWYFDARLVRLALEAALHNARRYAPQPIVLGARGEDGYLVFSVADNGPGLGAPDAADPVSTGLGSELCAAVARVHGIAGRPGRSRLVDRPQGGALFELWLA